MTALRHALPRPEPGAGKLLPDWGARQQLLIALMQSRQRELQLESALAESEAARHSHTSWSRLANHELRSHLHALHLHLLLLQHRAGQEVSPEADEAFQDAFVAWSRLVEFVDTLLEVGRCRDGALRLEPVDLGRLGAQVVAWLEPTAAERGLRLEHHETAGPPVVTDASLLRILVTNLLDNALRYTREGRVLLETLTTPGGARLRVADTGPGIPEGACQRVLECYQRLPSDQGRGAGLGLSIVAHLVRELGGTLDLKSREGQGTVFTVWLPSRP